MASGIAATNTIQNAVKETAVNTIIAAMLYDVFEIKKNCKIVKSIGGILNNREGFLMSTIKY